MWQCTPHGQFDCEYCQIEEIPELSYGNPSMKLHPEMDSDGGATFLFKRSPTRPFYSHDWSQGPSTSGEPTHIQCNKVPKNTVEKQISTIQPTQVTEDAELSTDLGSHSKRDDKDTLLEKDTDIVENRNVAVKKPAKKNIETVSVKPESISEVSDGIERNNCEPDIAGASVSKQLRVDDGGVQGEQSEDTVSNESQISKVTKELDSVSIDYKTTEVGTHSEKTIEDQSLSRHAGKEILTVSNIDADSTNVQQFTKLEKETESEILENNADKNNDVGTSTPQISTETDEESSQKSPVNSKILTSDNDPIQPLDQNQEILKSISDEELLIEKINFEAQTIGTSGNRPSDTQPTQTSSVGEYQVADDYETKSSPTHCIKEKHGLNSEFVTKSGSPEMQTTSGKMKQEFLTSTQASSLGEYHETDTFETESSPIKEADTVDSNEASHILAIEKKDDLNTELVSKPISPETEEQIGMMKQETPILTQSSSMEKNQVIDAFETKSSPIKVAEAVDSSIERFHNQAIQENNGSNSELISKPGSTESEAVHEITSQEVPTSTQASSVRVYQWTDDFEMKISPIREAKAVDQSIEASHNLPIEKKDVSKPKSPETEEQIGMMKQETPIPTQSSSMEKNQVIDAFETKSSPIKVAEAVDSSIERFHNQAIQENNGSNSELVTNPESTNSEESHEILSEETSTQESSVGEYQKTDAFETKSRPTKEIDTVDDSIASSHHLSMKKKNGSNSELSNEFGNPETVARIMKQEISTPNQTSSNEQFQVTDAFETKSSPIREAGTVDSIEASYILAIKEKSSLNSELFTNPKSPITEETSRMTKQENPIVTQASSVGESQGTDDFEEKSSPIREAEVVGDSIEASHNLPIEKKDGLNSQLVTKLGNPEIEEASGIMKQETPIPTQSSSMEKYQVIDAFETKNSPIIVTEAVNSFIEPSHNHAFPEDNGLNSELFTNPESPTTEETSRMMKQENPIVSQESSVGESQGTDDFKEKNSPIIVGDSIEASHNLPIEKKDGLNSQLFTKPSNPESEETSGMMKQETPIPTQSSSMEKYQVIDAFETKNSPIIVTEAVDSFIEPSHNHAIPKDNGLNSELISKPGSTESEAVHEITSQELSTPTQTSLIEQNQVTNAFETKNSPMKVTEAVDSFIEPSHNHAIPEDNGLNSELISKPGSTESGAFHEMEKQEVPTPTQASSLGGNQRADDFETKISPIREAKAVDQSFEASHNQSIKKKNVLNSKLVTKSGNPEIGATSGMVKQELPTPTQTSSIEQYKVSDACEAKNSSIKETGTVHNSIEASHDLSIKKKSSLNSELVTRPEFPKTKAASGRNQQEIPTPPANKSVKKKMIHIPEVDTDSAHVLSKSKKKADKNSKNSCANPVPEELASLGCSSSSPVDSQHVAVFSSDSEHDNSDTTTKQVLEQVSSTQNSDKNDGGLNKTTSPVQRVKRATRDLARVNYSDVYRGRAVKRQNNFLESQRLEKDKRTNDNDGTLTAQLTNSIATTSQNFGSVENNTRVNDIGNGAQLLQISENDRLYENIKRFTNLSRDDFDSCIEWTEYYSGKPIKNFKRKHVITLLFKEKHGIRSVDDYEHMAKVLSSVKVNHPSQCEIPICSPRLTSDVQCTKHNRKYMTCQDYENRLWPVSTFSDFKCSKSVQDSDIEERKIIDFSTAMLNTLKYRSSHELKTQIAKTLLAVCITLAERNFFNLPNIEEKIKAAVTISDSNYITDFSKEPLKFLTRGVYALEKNSCLPWLQWFFRFSTEHLQPPNFDDWEDDWKSIIAVHMRLRASELTAELLETKQELENAGEWNEDAQKHFEQQKKAAELALINLDRLKAEDFGGYFDTNKHQAATPNRSGKQKRGGGSVRKVNNNLKIKSMKTLRFGQPKNAKLSNTTAHVKSEEPDQSTPLEEKKRPAKRGSVGTSDSTIKKKQMKVSVPDNGTDIQLDEEHDSEQTSSVA